MTSILFPLRSSCGLFADERSRAVLETRLKRALLLYDEIVLQDGRYLLTVWERGNLDFDLAPLSIPDDRTKLDYYTPGGVSEFLIEDPTTGAKHPILSGPTIAAYQVDFYPILHDAGLLGVESIKLVYFAPTEDTKARIKASADEDKRNRLLFDAAHGTHFQKGKLIEAVHFDSSLAFYLKSSLATDHRVASFIEAKNRQIAGLRWQEDLRDFVFGTLTTVILPDLSSLGWEEILRVRESAAGGDLRQAIGRIAADTIAAISELSEPRDAELIVHRLLMRELIDEIRRHQPTARDLALDIALNFIPYGGLIGGATAVADLVGHNQSWFSLVRQQ